jgi:hypothetical protein
MLSLIVKTALPHRTCDRCEAGDSRPAGRHMVQEVGYAMLRSLGVTLVAADSPSSFLDDGPTSNLIRQILGAVSEFDKAWLRPSHPNDFNHTFQWLAELTGKAGRVVPSST